MGLTSRSRSSSGGGIRVVQFNCFIFVMQSVTRNLEFLRFHLKDTDHMAIQCKSPGSVSLDYGQVVNGPQTMSELPWGNHSD